MDIVLLLKATTMGIVEGLTEFLPISSTGHLILAGALLGFHDDKAKVFDIAIQTGAILAVIIIYWARIRGTLTGLTSSRRAQRFAANVLIGFLPAGVVGFFAYKAIKILSVQSAGGGRCLYSGRFDHSVGGKKGQASGACA